MRRGVQNAVQHQGSPDAEGKISGRPGYAGNEDYRESLGRFLSALGTCTTNKELGEALGVSKAAVRQRFQRLEARGFISMSVTASGRAYAFTPKGIEFLHEMEMEVPGFGGTLDYSQPIVIAGTKADGDKTRQEVLRMHDAGADTNQIAAALGITGRHVTRVIGPRYTPGDVQMAFSAGGTIIEMSERLGVHRDTMYRLLDRNGLRKIRRRTRGTGAQDASGGSLDAAKEPSGMIIANGDSRLKDEIVRMFSERKRLVEALREARRKADTERAADIRERLDSAEMEIRQRMYDLEFLQ
ncbi:MAG: winged helix-turn-helix transcriptional regulator [Candidatus Micrarchaeota archaeon]|nr:winged helix-turn-helix transcriptional regulator [Candidatus Micrarchaeota archaeon]